MRATELKQKFESTGTKPVDFRNWAKSKGVNIHAAQISRYLSEKKYASKISGMPKLAFIAFFDSLP